jgi:hypothetical protein
MTDDLLLTGLDGSNPLAFFAALGALRMLEESGLSDVRLAWRDDGLWRPVLRGVSQQELLDRLSEDQSRWSDCMALQLAYGDEGELAENGQRDLKPAPAAFAQYLERAAVAVAELGPPARRDVDLLAAFGTELAEDNNARVKPTAFHFTAGQQAFLKMVQDLYEGVTQEDLTEALFGPWRGTSRLPSMSWDATATRFYALRATNPSGEKRGSNPGADLLAILGLTYFPVACISSRLETTAVRGGWKDSVFTWPLWNDFLRSPTIRALVARRDLPHLSAAQCRALGIPVLFQSDIARSAQGGYGSFSPARVL